LAVALTASAFAQGWGQGRGYEREYPRMQQRPRIVMEAVTVSGTLVVAHGRPAIKSGDVTYLVGGLNRLTGFVDGLKEGAQVTIEGLTFSNRRDDEIKMLMPEKLTLAGKSYDMKLPENHPLRESFRNFRNNIPDDRGRRQAPPERNNPHGRQHRNIH